MRNLLILVFGLLLFSLLGYVCIYQKHANTIQADISNRVNTLLQNNISVPMNTATDLSAVESVVASTGDNVVAKVDGRDITLMGTVTSETLKLKAEEMAKVHGYRTLDNQLTVVKPVPLQAEPAQVKPVQPYRFTATKFQSKDVMLEGFVPSSEIQQQLVTFAKEKYGEKQVTDKLVVTPYMPDAQEGWLKTAQATLSSLAVLDSGKATLIDEKLVISGEAAAEEILKKIKADISDGINTNHQASFNITVPEPLLEASTESLDESSSTDASETHPSSTKPSETDASDQATTDQAKNDEKANEKSTQEQQNTACQKQFEQLLEKNTIHFRTSSAIISPTSLSLLNELVKVTQECATQTVSVEGHTDATGPAELNQRLSQLRAESVVNYLVQQGIDKGRLVALGRGENNPIADNTTKPGRAANRRIEFIVKEAE